MSDADIKQHRDAASGRDSVSVCTAPARQPDVELAQLRHMTHQQALEIRRLENALLAFIEQSPPPVLRAALELVAASSRKREASTRKAST